jgi:hypothetical protein
MWLGIVGALIALVFLVLCIGPHATLFVLALGVPFTLWSLQLARAARKPPAR